MGERCGTQAAITRTLKAAQEAGLEIDRSRWMALWFASTLGARARRKLSAPRLRHGWQSMVRIDLKHIHRQRKQTGGRIIEYHSIRGGKGSTFWRSTDNVELGGPEYVDAYRAAKRRPTDSKAFGGIITAYLDSGEFRALAPRTKADYRRWCEEIRKKFGDSPIEAFSSPKIRQVATRWRDRWTGRNALYAWTMLRRIVTWAYDAGMLYHHHLKGGSRGLYRASRAEVVWTGDDIATFCGGAPEWLARILTLACETGFRPGDLVKLTRANVQKTPEGRQISVRTGKSRGRSIAAVPVTEAAARIIDSTPAGHLLILTNEKGTALSEEWASKAVKKRARGVGLDERLASTMPGGPPSRASTGPGRGSRSYRGTSAGSPQPQPGCCATTPRSIRPRRTRFCACWNGKV
ncbi:MAG: hypothetical protein AAGC57_20740 [Pseudomonadota bacterium]